jgi:iron complex transport system permease protein
VTRAGLGLVGSALGLVAAVLLALTVGSTTIPLLDVVGGLVSGTGRAGQVVWAVRLPEAATAGLAGGGLAAAGVVMQTLFANPLAEPYVLGVSAGASLGVAVVVAGAGVGIAGAGGLVAGVVGLGWAWCSRPRSGPGWSWGWCCSSPASSGPRRRCCSPG